jgi:hypothetical protein
MWNLCEARERYISLYRPGYQMETAIKIGILPLKIEENGLAM